MKQFIFAILIITTTAHAQNVGIGTILPKARLHVADSAVLFTGPTSLPANAGKPPITGVGTRMMWYPNKGAFRAGQAIGDSWDEINTGRFSAAFNQAKAFGSNSFAAGSGNSANGSASAAFGIGNEANSVGSFVIGRLANSTGNATTWVDTEDLFVIGNGYVDTVVVGGVTTYPQVKQNAFRVRKNGNASFNGNINANEGLTVDGTSTFNGSVNVVAPLSTFSTTKFYNNVELADTVFAGNEAIMSNKGGTVPNMDLVPICVYEFLFTVSNGVLPSFSQSGTSLYGNLVSTIENVSDANLSTINATIGGLLHFNSTIANRYTKIIAVPSVSYRGEGLSDDARIIKTESEIIYDVNGKAIAYEATFRTDDQPLAGVLSVKGTVMFYGLKLY